MRYIGLPFIFASLIAGLLAGLWRAGFTQVDLGTLGMVHGSLMTGSFLGSLISLERAIVVRKWYAYLVPILGGSSMPVFFFDREIALLMLCAVSLGFLAIMCWLYFKYNEWYHLIFITGAGCWFIGNVLILTGDYYFFATPWWMLFLLLTITAERMELARFILLKKSRVTMIILFLALSFIGLMVPFHSGGKEMIGSGFSLLALSLLRYDIARKNVRSKGFHKFSGYALLTGYVWLLLSGLGMAFLPYSGLMYDAILHSFFVGFVFSMIFAHGPIILPTVLKTGTYVFNPALYVWLIALHLGLAFRVAGDFLYEPWWRLIGSWANAIAILGFLVTVGALVARNAIALKAKPKA